MQIPPPLLQSLQNVAGFNNDAFVAAHHQPAATSIRLNPAKPLAIAQYDFNVADAVAWCKHGHYLAQRPSFTFDPLFHAGTYYVQEASSMFLWHIQESLFANNTAIKVLDLCAAPGGKSTLLASFFTDGLLVSNEVIKSRAHILEDNITKWGSQQVVVTQNDPANFKSLSNFFDLIVVDAPCSGSGLFRKDAAAIDEWSEDNVAHCAQRQHRILTDILPCLKENGILIYATCSYSEAENEQVADWLLEQEMESIAINQPEAWQIVNTVSKKGAHGYRFFPHLTKGEGFFCAVFKKQAPSINSKVKNFPPLHKPDKNEQALLLQLLPQLKDYSLFSHNQLLHAFPEEWLGSLLQLASTLYIKKAGIILGAIKGRDLIPHHNLAMTNINKQFVQQLEVDKATAIAYLQRHQIELETTKQGWALLTFKQIALGWIKVLPNRINNYYPNEWRILKS